MTDANFSEITSLAKRPYDLRHACVSTWLKAGIGPKRVAEWAGHSAEVLLRIYTHGLDGGEDEARKRIQRTLIRKWVSYRARGSARRRAAEPGWR